MDPEIFFPDKGGSTKDAKFICSRCEVSEQCLEWAVSTDQRFGVYGGKSERDRLRMARKRLADSKIENVGVLKST